MTTFINKDILVIQNTGTSDINFTEVPISPESGKVLGFDSSKNPVMLSFPERMNWKGVWTYPSQQGNYISYNLNDCVSYKGNLYICIQSHQVDYTQNIIPTNVSYWQIVVKGSNDVFSASITGTDTSSVVKTIAIMPSTFTTGSAKVKVQAIRYNNITTTPVFASAQTIICEVIFRETSTPCITVSSMGAGNTSIDCFENIRASSVKTLNNGHNNILDLETTSVALPSTSRIDYIVEIYETENIELYNTDLLWDTNYNNAVTKIQVNRSISPTSNYTSYTLMDQATNAKYTSRGNFGVLTYANQGSYLDQWLKVGDLTMIWSASSTAGRSGSFRINLSEQSRIDNDNALENFWIIFNYKLNSTSTSALFNSTVPVFSISLEGNLIDTTTSDIAAVVTSTSTSSKVISLYVRARKSNKIFNIAQFNGNGTLFSSTSASSLVDLFNTSSQSSPITSLPTPAQGSVVYSTLISDPRLDLKENLLSTNNTTKDTPVNTDTIVISDSANNNVTKKLTFDKLKSFLSTYFSTLYANISHIHSESDITNLTTDLASKVPTSRTINSKALTSDIVLTPTDIGLSNVDNTSDLNKPISIATQTALNGKVSWGGDTNGIKKTIGAIDNQDIGIITNNTERATITKYGKIGINTYLPTAQLSQKSTLATESAPLGAELTDVNNWTLTSGWSGDYVNGFTHASGAGVTVLSRTMTISTESLYQISWTVTNRTTGSFTVSLGGQVSVQSYTASGAFGPKTLNNTDGLIFTPTNDFNGTISNISVKNISGAYGATFDIQDNTGVSTLEIRSSLNSLNNTFIGKNAGNRNTTGYYNSFIGASAGLNNTTGNYNSFIGYYAGLNNTIGSNNSFFGVNAGLNNTTGSYNSFIGVNAGRYNTTGSFNSFIGYYAGYNNTTGYSNAFIGAQAGQYNTTGYFNSFFGMNAGYNNTTGYFNSFIGYSAGYSNTTGIRNSFIGSSAGRYLADGSTGRLTGNNGLYLGYNSKASVDGTDNEIVIGYNAIGAGSNTVTLGNDSITKTLLKGNVGIGTTDPNYKLDVNGTIKTNNQLISTIATGTAPLSVTSTTKVDNLNVDLLDGKHSTDFANAAHTHSESDITGLSDDLSTKITQRGLWTPPTSESGSVLYQINDLVSYSNKSYICLQEHTLNYDDQILLTNESYWRPVYKENYGTSTSDVKMNGTVSVGSVDAIARIDHIHPTDTSRAASVHTHSESDITNLVSDLAGKVPTSRTINSKALTSDIVLTPTDIGLSNVDNTSDLNKPISIATQTALNGKVSWGGDTNGIKKTIGAIDNYGIGLITNNIERLTVTSDGKVGIGTITPTAQLSQKSTLDTESAPLGAELTSSANWTLTTGWSGDYATGFTHTSGTGVTALSRTMTITAGALYQIAWSVTNRTTGSFTVSLGGQGSGTYTASGSFGPKALNSTGDLVFTPSSDFNGTISLISVKQNTGSYGATYNILDNTGVSTLEIRSSLNSLNNTFIGNIAGSRNTTGYCNSFFGYGAGINNTTGFYNTANGFFALRNNTTGFYNTAFGAQSLQNNTMGIYNSAFGYLSLYANTTGNYNSAFGDYSLATNTSGIFNCAFGDSSLSTNSTGVGNTANGVNALKSNTTGNYNSAFGIYALTNNTTGSYNTALGRDAGRYLADGTTGRLTGNNGLYLGADTKASADGTTNENVFGYGAIGAGSNSVVLGNDSITKTLLKGNVGIGTTSPTAQLSQKSTLALESAPLGAELTSSDNWTLTSGWAGDYATGFTHTSGAGTTTLSRTMTITAGALYQISWTVTNRTTGSFTVSLGGQVSGTYTTSGAFGPKALNSTGDLVFTPSSDFNGTISLISVKQNTGSYGATYNILDNTGVSTLEIRSSLNSLNNTFIGKNAGNRNTTGYYNSFFGPYAGQSNTTGYYNSFIGMYAGLSNTTGTNNSFLGASAGQNNTTGSYNSFIGIGAGYYNTTGNNNSFMGLNAGQNNTTGSANSFIGMYAGSNNTTGSNNSFMGMYAGSNNTTGSYNSFMGMYAGNKNTTGNNNSFLGASAGRYIADGVTGRLTGNNGLYLGAETKASADGTDNENVLGYGAIGAGSNSVVLGNDSITKTLLKGNIGIGTTDPNYKLDVNGTIKTNNQLISTIATGTAPLSVTSTTKVDNLNVDLLDGKHSTDFANAAHTHSESDITNLTTDLAGKESLLSTNTTMKEAVVDNDYVVISDSEASYATKKTRWATIILALWTIFYVNFYSKIAFKNPSNPSNARMADSDTICITDNSDSDKVKKIPWTGFKSSIRRLYGTNGTYNVVASDESGNTKFLEVYCNGSYIYLIGNSTNGSAGSMVFQANNAGQVVFNTSGGGPIILQTNGAGNVSFSTPEIIVNTYNHIQTDISSSITNKLPNRAGRLMVEERITISQSDPSGGVDGDIWIKY